MHDPLSTENIRAEKNGIKDRYQDIRTYSETFEEYIRNISSFVNQAFVVFTNKADNYTPTKYLLYDSLVKLKEMKRQTILFGNPYSSAKELEHLCNKEERIIIKLLEQWSFYP